ncbi:GntR family transcriptional regulator [Salisediminibacterium beveridgei]|uniref:Transcriptional regulator, GntR family n=1 Tax=Salisediminibacterium beveridgei TaxID=632773 RepID=A0A1D7QRA0_9BACI|nr:GntR family transcriptional regulator [Salisediminibacterium beveridgei]AOM81536.1 Transcriptional regulator, GntR family [Salisediminibacterium beveridgei]
MLNIDIRSRVPIYEQLMNQLKSMIIHEVIAADEQLPSVRNLAQELTINPNTIQKAYRELEREGYIYSIPGRGRFVSPQTHHQNKERLTMLTEEIETMISEYLYLGGTKDNILAMLHTKDEADQGGEQS